MTLALPTAAKVQLRPYQVDAVNAVETAWARGVHRPAVVLATGLGKTVVIAELATRARREGRRVVLLAHQDKLLHQMAAAVSRADPHGEHVGIVAAELDDPTTEIVAATFQTIKNPRRFASVGHRDLVITDEAHHAPAPSFRKVLESFGATNTGTTLAAGFTATMSRADERALGHIWDEVVYEHDLAWAVQNGYLVPPRGKTVHIAGLSKLADISQVAGDYKKSDLAEVMGRTAEATVGAILAHASERPMIVFAVDVAHAHSIADLLNASGIVAEVMSGKTPRKERNALYEGYANGLIQALVNVQVLTEGVDLPRCDTVVMARPTRSQTLYSQAVGRALRLWTDPETGESKTDALVLDLVGVVRDLRLVTVTDLLPTAKNTNFDEQGREILPKGPSDSPGREQALAAEIPDLVDIDLFNQKSSVVWLQTEGGVYFTPVQDARDSYVFLWPPNPVNAPQVALGRAVGPNVEFLRDRQGELLWGSMAEARERASQSDILPPNKALSPRAPWRRRRVPPSEKQVDLARKLRIDPSQFPSKAELSDALTRFWANKTFQRMSRIINVEAGLATPMWDSGFTFRNTPDPATTA